MRKREKKKNEKKKREDEREKVKEDTFCKLPDELSTS